MQSKIIDSVLTECDGLPQSDQLSFVEHTLKHMGLPFDKFSIGYKYALNKLAKKKERKDE